MKKIYLLFMAATVAAACGDKDKERLPGDWSDNIHLSEKELVFEAEGGTRTVTTEGDWWCIEEIVDLTGGVRDAIQVYGDYDSVDTAYVHKWMTVERIGYRTIRVTADANPSAQIRKGLISLVAGNYLGRLDIIQKAA